MNRLASNLFRFFILIILQILVCNYVHLFGFLNPYLYIMALLLLPVKVPKWVQYIIAFATGFVVDIFMQSYGVQSFACVLMMFMRSYVIYWLNGRKPIKGTENLLTDGDFAMKLSYTVVLVLVHHFSVALLETFSFHHLWKTLLIAVGNTIFTTFLIIAIEYILLIRMKSKS